MEPPDLWCNVAELSSRAMVSDLVNSRELRLSSFELLEVEDRGRLAAAALDLEFIP